MPIADEFISLFQLLEYVTLLVKHVMLLTSLLVSPILLLLTQLRLAILSFKTLPEVRVMRVSLPLLSQFLDIFVK